MANELKHTAGEWKFRISGTSTGRGPEIYVDGEHYDDGSEFIVAELGSSETKRTESSRWHRTEEAGQIEANAEFIVRAVNAHDELVEACKKALAAFEATAEAAPGTAGWLHAATESAKATTMAQRALRKAAGGTE